MKKICIALILIFLVSGFSKQGLSYQCPCEYCISDILTCSTECAACSLTQEVPTKLHFTTEMANHRLWMVQLFFADPVAGDPPGLLAAMMLMAEQLTTNAMLQVEIIGTFFDAKHQLETQRLFQTLTARAHKDYHPSQELCEVGTVTRSLAASERNSNLAAVAFSKRNVDRQLLSRDTLENERGVSSDERSRLVQFIQQFCEPEDNVGQLDLLCLRANAPFENRNKDIDYTSSVDLPLTLDIDLEDPAVSSDEEAFFALAANLISHQSMPSVSPDLLMSIDKTLPSFGNAAVAYLDSRAMVAKRSVAANSLASIMSLKAAGEPGSQPFIYALIEELSPDLFSEEDIANIIGERPSYYAQMEILTKKLYQHPNFYSDLYDKPVNVLRKDVAIQAADLMQKRDIFRSLLRSEAVLAVMLETALLKEQDKVANEFGNAKEGGGNRVGAAP